MNLESPSNLSLRHSLLKFAGMIILLLLPGCTLLHPAFDKSLEPTSADTMSHWKLKGKIGIRTKEDGGSAHLRWIQQGSRYELSLSGPLGQGAASIHGNQSGVTLKSRRTGTLYADTPEQLISKAFGWHVPISNLLYWIKGSPTPDHNLTQTHSRYDEAGRLESFSQHGWTIQYSRFRQVNELFLPHKTVIKQDDIKVTLIVSKWELGRQSL